MARFTPYIPSDSRFAGAIGAPSSAWVHSRGVNAVPRRKRIVEIFCDQHSGGTLELVAVMIEKWLITDKAEYRLPYPVGVEVWCPRCDAGLPSWVVDIKKFWALKQGASEKRPIFMRLIDIAEPVGLRTTAL